MIDYGVFVYQGHFDIPLAASLGHFQKAQAFFARKQLQEALVEAEQARASARLGENKCDARRYICRAGASGRGAYALRESSGAGKNGRAGIPEWLGGRAREKVEPEQAIS